MSQPSPDSSAPDSVAAALLSLSERCIRPPTVRFRHTWIGAMPPVERSSVRDDGFTSGDYSAGIFHHDASESAIELLLHDATREASAGSLLNLLDTAGAGGRVHRIELPHKSREREPAKPTVAQYALRAADAMGLEWIEAHDVYARARAHVEQYRREYEGLHGLALTPSSRGSGFDNDPMSAGFPPGTVEGPDTSALLVLEYDALAELAERLDDDSDAALYHERASRLRELIESLLYVEDLRGGFYRALRWRHGSASLDDETVSMPGPDGRPRPVESWASLLPLYAGVPSPERADRVIARLCDPDLYWGPVGPRTMPRSSPLFSQAARVMLYDQKRGHSSPVSNWCGPVWVLASYYMAAGLARYGRAGEAKQIADTTADLLGGDLDRTGGFHECYDDSGRGLWPPAPTFASWNVLAITMRREFSA